jgi:hypothetical protein
MIALIARLAYRLDQWLEQTLGRPYNVILGVGLVTEIVRRAVELPERLADRPRLIGEGLTMLMELALLIHQIGALSHHIERRGSGRRPRRSLARGRSEEFR